MTGAMVLVCRWACKLGNSVKDTIAPHFLTCLDWSSKINVSVSTWRDFISSAPKRSAGKNRIRKKNTKVFRLKFLDYFDFQHRNTQETLAVLDRLDLDTDKPSEEEVAKRFGYEDDYYSGGQIIHSDWIPSFSTITCRKHQLVDEDKTQDMEHLWWTLFFLTC